MENLNGIIRNLWKALELAGCGSAENILYVHLGMEGYTEEQSKQFIDSVKGICFENE